MTPTAKVIAWYHRATPEQRAAGLAWYDTGRRFVRGLAHCYHLSISQAAGIVAALSPRVQWSENRRLAVKVASAAARGATECPPACGLRGNARKAWAIAKGAPASDVLSGPKVRAFWANLQGCDDTVTVDVWAARAAGFKGHPVTRTYARMAGAYHRASARLGVPPAHVQAAVWVAIRGRAA